MNDRSEQAKEIFTNGANCAQAVLKAFCDRCGLTPDAAMRLASGFGGGIARQREVCGAVTGMTMAADLIRGPGEGVDKETKDAHYALIRELCDEFRAETGSIICRELLGLAPNQTDSPVSEARTPAYYKKRPCAELVALAAGILSKRLPD